jgi:hypothetical protein
MTSRSSNDPQRDARGVSAVSAVDHAMQASGADGFADREIP